MLMRALVTLVTLALLTVQSYAAAPAGLKAAFDELNYTLAVRGAGQSRESRRAALDVFANRVAALQAQGLSNAELISFSQAQIKDRAVAADVATAFAAIQADRLSAAEARDMVRDLVERSAQRGASWTGDATLMWTGLVFLLVIAFMVGSTQGEPLCADPAYYDAHPASCDPVIDDFGDDPWY